MDNWIRCIDRLPPKGKEVALLFLADRKFDPPHVAIGYLKYHTDVRGNQYPFFVTPGLGGDPVAWCDCLTDFEWPALKLCTDHYE